MTDTLSTKLRDQASNVEGSGWLNAARHMRNAADELEHRGSAYGTLRVALRNAVLRLAGTRVADVSVIYRDIEAGKIDLFEATDQIENLLNQVVDEVFRREIP